MTHFIWKSDTHVIAIDRSEDGAANFIEAKVRPDGSFEIIDFYQLPAEQSLNATGDPV